jgi:signal transduction histidine kinase
MLAPFRLRGFTPYLVGIVGVVIATILRHVSEPFLGEHLSFSFHFLAVSLAAWIGGIWPAVATAVLSALFGNFVFTDPYLINGISIGEELVSLFFFLLVSVIVGVLSELSLRSLVRAKQAEQEKDNFLAVLAHEMRSPISVIYYANALNRLDSTQSDGQVDVIDRQIQQLNVLIEDLLDVSRIARGKIRLDCKPTDAAAVIERALEKSRPLVVDHNHKLNVDVAPEPLPILVDPPRMEQVLANLVINAAKYTPDGGQIDVRVHREDDSVVFAVRDNGIGISKEALPHVFDMFVQVDSSSERAGGGLGIGLNLVQKIVEMHGGSVRASSTGLNQGSEFVVRLPVHQAASGPAPSAAPHNADHAGACR